MTLYFMGQEAVFVILMELGMGFGLG